MPDRVTQDNLLFVVSDHERRLKHQEDRTEDINVMRSDLSRCTNHVHDIRSDIAAIRLEMREFASHDDVDGLRKALYTFALSVAGSAMLFAITLFAVLK